MTQALGTRREWLFIILAGFFITNAVTAELISNKLFQIGPFTTIVGILPWPVVFLVTDLLNEFYGKKAVRRLSWITAGLIAYCFVIVVCAMQLKSVGGATDEQYNAVFGQAPWIIVGSIIAFLFAQLLDTTLFAYLKTKTGNRMIWLRATGSTFISQFFDTFIVAYIGFVLPGKWSWDLYFEITPVSYALKLIIALALTPLIYVGHFGIRRYLKEHHVIPPE
ncbi:MAG: queuosine precursor transporter [Flavobacteriales bacterium]|nr:queuosine precursor transporter [Flavobacteriales bacterium]